MSSFDEMRRQIFIDEESYRATMDHFRGDEAIYAERLAEPRKRPGGHATPLRFRASALWDAFQLRYTAGEELPQLRRALTEIVEAFEAYVAENEETPDDEYAPPFLLDDMIDTYVDYLNLLSAAILLHREDLIPRIYGLIEGGDYDGADAVIEELLKFYLPDRPALDKWFWDKPYRLLLDAIDAPGAKERETFMTKYVQGWYKSMKGRANFWGTHETIEPSFSPYFGYWAMCAAAVTYLYDIDDQKYRDELVYPKDLVDYARSTPHHAVTPGDEAELLRGTGG